MEHKMDEILNDQPYWSQTHTPVDVVVLPSITLESDEDFMRVPGLVHKEERHLFTTLFLRNPELQLIYITSYPLDAAVIQYYLSLLPPEEAVPFNPEAITERKVPVDGHDVSIIEFIPKRFYNVCLHDMEEIALADKLSKKYAIMETVKSLLRKLEPSYMLCYRTSKVEERISHDLGLNLIASPSRLDHFGSKSGSRSIFEESQIPFMPGTSLVHTVKDLAATVRDLIASEWKNQRTLNKIVLKLDNFSAGGGNAVLDMSSLLKGRKDVPSAEEVEKHFQHLQPPYSDQNANDYLRFVPECGAIAEVWAEPAKGGQLTSPLVQCMISATGKVSVISSHGQVLDGHEYAGGCFPAPTSNHDKLYTYAEQVGKVLRDKGVRGHFGIDFIEIVEPTECGGTKWSAYAIEINLRFTGTTGPYLVLRLLAPGEYDRNKGSYAAKSGGEKFYATTEGMKSNNLKGVTPRDLLDLTQIFPELQWNRNTETGTLFHMLGGVDKFAKIGVTCVYNTAQEAQDQLEKVREVFQTMDARAALQKRRSQMESKVAAPATVAAATTTKKAGEVSGEDGKKRAQTSSSSNSNSAAKVASQMLPTSVLSTEMLLDKKDDKQLLQMITGDAKTGGLVMVAPGIMLPPTMHSPLLTTV
eukprot:TRINITY_DN894_c0_g1_i1.p1 TRINITY_DN894_c0_g1~~TRINITY_DN894_c0_g1_i1.p1  ORF type:complete len:641 (+),score=124.03 TRINITY_DN894_c0_g1_i1:185-2107(+)